MNMSFGQIVASMSAPRDGCSPELWRHLPVGLGAFDARLQLECCNPAFEALCGGSQTELRGSYLLHVLPLAEDRLPSIMAALKLRGRWHGIAHDNQRALRIEMTRLTLADGSTQYPVSIIDYAEDLRQLQEQSAARELAERTDRAKSRFLSHMSHELRTPLNAILGFTQLMQAAGDLPTVQQDNLREIANAGNYLLGLINEILDLSRIEAGNLRLHAESLTLERLIRDCLVLLRPMAGRKQVEIGVDCRLQEPLQGDQVRLKQVLLNLLTNAIKYNHQGGKVRVHCFPVAGARLRIEISDSGPGIRQDIQASIFSPFARLAADAAAGESAGIGLMITRRLVQLMGGRIGLCSEPGHGSVFWLELPLAGPQEGETASDTAAAPGGRSVRLLSVGNDAAFNSLLHRLQPLRGNLELRCADTPAAALDLLAGEPADCVLLRSAPGNAHPLWQEAAAGRTRIASIGSDSAPGAATAALPANPSLPELLSLIDSLDAAQPEPDHA